jgi:hypothetical protein
MRLSPCTDNVNPPEKRRSLLGAGAEDDDEDDEVGAEGAGGVCGASWPAAQYTHTVAATHTFTRVFKQSSN